jgi:hypothetical protein
MAAPVLVNDAFVLRECETILGTPAGSSLSEQTMRMIAAKVLPDDQLFHPRSSDRIRRMVWQGQSLDWLLYLTRKRYRDHCQHQFKVGILGWYLLGTNISREETLRQFFARKLGCEAAIVDRAWWIASLLHDHAYPIAHVFRMLPVIGSRRESESGLVKLFKVYEGFYDEHLVNLFRDGGETTRRLLKEWLFCLFTDSELTRLLQNEQSTYDHGIWAAANILAGMRREGWPFFKVRGSPRKCGEDRQCGNELRKPNAVCPAAKDDHYGSGIFCLKQALRAIAIHNLGSYRPVTCADDPIGFLLILCDELQEWNRQTMVGYEADSEASFIELDGIVADDGIRRFEPTLQVRFQYDADKIKKSDWDYGVFYESKKEAFSRLGFVGECNPNGISLEVKIPFNGRMA